MVESRYITLKDNALTIFLEDKQLLGARQRFVMVQGSLKEIKIIQYVGFELIHVDGIVTLIMIPNDSNVQLHPSFIDVTENERYQLAEILHGSLQNTGIILEGTDGVGKTTLTCELAKKGYLCQDRCIHQITKKMKPEIPKDERIKSVQMYLENNAKKVVLFLFLSDVQLLSDRIHSRKEISKYDEQALLFQALYLDTYEELKHYPNLSILDCSYLSILDVMEEIKKRIPIQLENTESMTGISNPFTLF